MTTKPTRKDWPVRIYRLGEEPPDDLSAATTAAARIEMVSLLSRRAWEISSQALARTPAPNPDDRRTVVREGGVPDDPSDLLVALLENGARFLVVGAHALAAHGVPRATQDLDLWIDPEPTNATRVWHSLLLFGAPLRDLYISQADLSTPDTVVQLGLPPNRIDLLTSLSGVDRFDDAWAERVEHLVRGRLVPFLGRATLIRTKRASGRRKDLADLEALGELPD